MKKGPKSPQEKTHAPRVSSNLKHNGEKDSTNGKHSLAHTGQEGASAVGIGIVIGIGVVLGIVLGIVFGVVLGVGVG